MTKISVFRPCVEAAPGAGLKISHPNPLSANPAKWSNTFDHFLGLALKGLRLTQIIARYLWKKNELPLEFLSGIYLRKDCRVKNEVFMIKTVIIIMMHA